MAYTSMENAIILKGTRHGLLASVREDADWKEVLRELAGLMAHNASFLKDAQLVLDFGWRELCQEQFDAIIEVLKDQGIGCNGILSTSLNTRTIAEGRGYRAIIGRLGLAQHHGRRLRRDQQPEEVEPTQAVVVAESPEPVRVEDSVVMALEATLPKTEVLAAEADSSEVAAATDLEKTLEQPLIEAAVPATVEIQPLAIEADGQSVEEMRADEEDSVPELVVAESKIDLEEPAGELTDSEVVSVIEDSLELPASEESSIEELSSAFDSADPAVANLPTVFDSSEIDGPRVFTSSQEPGIHVPHYQDEEPTLYIRKTLRSGQRVMFAGNVVLLGDLNPGAQIEADGDVIVLGQLRGSVHAGCEGDEDATVITSSLRATQLRIADRFYKAESSSRFFRKSPPTGTLRARLDGDTVVVEALPAR